jgi:hypothetical protein
MGNRANFVIVKDQDWQPQQVCQIVGLGVDGVGHTQCGHRQMGFVDVDRDDQFGRLRRPLNLLASLRLVTKDGLDIFVKQPNSRINTA